MRARLAIGLAFASILGAVAGAGLAAAAEFDHGHASESAGARCAWPPREFPADDRVRDAAAYAQGRGMVGFAVIDGCGGVRGYEEERRFSSASISKALLLAAFLARHRDLTESDRSTLESMITYSDNGAGDAIYANVGDDGLAEAARRAGMRDFEPDPGFWGGSQVTAADIAHFFFGLDHNLAGPQREFGKHLLASIVESQRWGIPAAAGPEWRTWFKGGWRPAGQDQTTGPVTHQGALLEHSSGERLAIAVLTDQAPGSESYATVEGIAERLLTPPPRPRIWVSA